MTPRGPITAPVVVEVRCADQPDGQQTQAVGAGAAVDRADSGVALDGSAPALVLSPADVAEAIEHAHVGGPEAVRRATEAVVGTMVRTAEPGQPGGITRMRVFTAVAAV